MKRIKTGFIINISSLVLLILLMPSCEQRNTVTEEDQISLEEAESKLDEIDSKRALLVESIIRSSPTLSQTGELFAKLSSDFHREYLNSIDNVQKYTTLKSQGINLGTYMADLGYITTFEQSQEVIFYLNSAQKLAEAIGVSDVFNESIVERIEMNINDKDSIIDIISDLYWKTDAFLKELNRENISALIICGGWIEGMHIGSRLISDGNADNLIYEQILDQRKNLKKIMALLATFEGDENIDFFESRLKEIQDDFSTVPELVQGEITVDQKESINLVAEKIEVLRNEIIQP